MLKLFKSFLKEEDGSPVLEYLLILLVSAVLIMVLLRPIREWIVVIYNRMVDNVNESVGAGGTVV